MGKTSENDDWSKDFGDFSVLFWLLLKPKKNRTWSQKLPKARSIPANACRAPPPRAHRGSICCTSWRTSARRRYRHVSLDWSLVQAYQFVSTCIYLLFTAHTVIPKNRGERVCVCVRTDMAWLTVRSPKYISKDARHLPKFSFGRVTGRKLLCMKSFVPGPSRTPLIIAKYCDILYDILCIIIIIIIIIIVTIINFYCIILQSYEHLMI